MGNLPQFVWAPPYGNEWTEDPNEKDPEEIAEIEPQVEEPEDTVTQLAAAGWDVTRLPPTVQQIASELPIQQAMQFVSKWDQFLFPQNE